MSPPRTPLGRRLLPEGSVPRPLLAVLTIVALLAILMPLVIVANAPRIVPIERKVARARPPQRVIPPAELPPVEPAEFVAVSREDAVAYNASIPFSTAPLLSARPFRIIGDEASIARATDCLTAGVLYEAGDDTVGQRAVAQVILNRVRHPAFPKTICGVVFQGAERRTGCQFTFTCDGALARRYSEAAWARAHDVAAAALRGKVEKAVGTATHYHTNWVVPYWSSSLDKISEVHTHLFFRWTGWWGTPPAFNGRYVAAEPLIAKMKGIAPSHGAAEDVPIVAGEVAIDLPILAPEAMPKPLAGDPNSFLVTLDRRLPPGEYAAYAGLVCADRPYCKFLAWTDRADTPAALPGDPRQMERMAFSYLRDRARGFDKALWACDRFPRPEPGQCMKVQVFMPSPARADSPRLEALPGSGLRAALGAGEAKENAPTELTGVRRRTGTLAPTVPAPAAPPPVRRTMGPELPKPQ
ncbi:cell wall hydrolase [Sphingomonas spermidinifaciens]|uniref:Cell wall hydrolase n=1 Tax=Sphingomonas spermidinifaciens TaxID=1141889 RepID=A0A2A4B985_9SPHN|nr:cell wall hydrolase [Sphingomonas spermidinifaciens]PCD04630.1 cell wall hydrolase [Sphingomonas spermidinifaciens]